jgi:hypothetical protein
VLWPDLVWEVVTGVGDAVLHEWLVRASSATSPVLQDFSTMQPWSCVVGDVVAAHPGSRQVDLQLTSRWGVVLDDQLATFVWGLLQHVGPAQV